ncbi:MAG TPA: serine/threonine-protein kinase [Ruminiclostridium sp.]
MQDNSFYSKYKYIRSLGHGGCGEVFLAESITLGNLWAVKEIVKGLKTSISGYIEPEILKRLNHPALPRICDVYEDETKIYIVEDYLEGICLKQELDIKGKFDEQTVIDWAIQLCSVLEYLHYQKPNPIIYGDMKPHNIILTKEGFVKLIDFGVSSIVRQADDEATSASGKDFTNDTAFIGTKGYAAPEQFIGNGISRASDIYSLGITLIQLITGIDPLTSIARFQNEKYAEYLSPGLFEILRKCVHPNSELRYQTAGILMKELRQYSLHNGSGNEDNIENLRKPLKFTKIIAITGARGTGVSTMTAAMAEHMARGPTSVCIVDLSISSSLQKSLSNKKENSDFTKPNKINSNWYYINLNNLKEKIQSDDLPLHKQLGQLQDSFSYIFIDIDITLVKYIEQYLNHIFIVSDMNPFNSADIGQRLKVEGMVEKCISRTSFIINKFYKGELSSRNILQSIFLNGDVQQLQDLIVYSKTFDVPYDPKVYLKWVYSFFGEALRFKNLFEDNFEQAISNILSNTISIQKSKRSHFSFSQLIKNKAGGIGQWAKD